MPIHQIRPGRSLIAWVIMAFLGSAASALPQDPASGPNPPEPNPTTTQPVGDNPEAVASRLRMMEQKLDALLGQNEQLARENQRLASQYEDLSRRVDRSAPGASSPAATRTPSKLTSSHVEAGLESETPDTTHLSGGGSKSSGGDPTASGRSQGVGNRNVPNIPIKPVYNFENDGFRFASDDSELELSIRAMSQVDARVFEQKNQSPTSGGIYNPRTRIYFEGRLTKPIQYEFSFQNFYDSVNLLDAYLDWSYDPRFHVRVGRYKNPHTYEFYRVHIWHLMAPERSLFATNFEANRRFGVMAHGSLFGSRMEYAVGTFDGQRNGFQAFNNSQDVSAFVNFKPFVNWEDSPLRDLQFGGSVDAGYENNPLSPDVLRTSTSPSPGAISSTSAVNSANIAFLAFNPNVRERGERALWELHAAYYYKGLSLMGAWDSGFQDYGIGKTGPSPVKVPMDGFFVQAGYLLTGETLRDRTLIDPLHPFDLRAGHFGLGAFELTARYSQLRLGKQVFEENLADPNRWTREVEMTDVGFNWYLNKFVKVYADWEHAMFANPVRYAPGPKLQKTSDLFWLRFQLYF